MIKSAYIHIPFCNNICSYCDFCKNYYDENIVSNYLDALQEEINNNYKKEMLDTIYIGGGTPSSLSLNNLNKLFKIMDTFKLSKTYEFTFECNYEDITEELLILLKNNKVNRLSIGIQTFNKKYKTFLNRNINKKKMLATIKLSKKYFNNINLDLIYGYNNQSMKKLKKDIKLFIKQDVKHISTYCLIIEDNTVLKIKKEEELDSDIQNKMYYLIINELKKKGYNHYEISNFAKDKYYSKHNLTYWNNENYYGFGAGASGFINNVRYNNTKSVNNYINKKIKVFEEKLSRNDLIKDEVMLNLRKVNGINLNDFYKKYNIDFDKVFNYKDLLQNKLLVKKDNNLYISEDKLFVSNEIIIKLLDSYILND